MKFTPAHVAVATGIFFILCFTKYSRFVKVICSLLWTICVMVLNSIMTRLSYSKRKRSAPNGSQKTSTPFELCVTRKSVRNYDPENPLTEAEISQIRSLISNPDYIKGPFGSTLHIELVLTEKAANQKLGTYGMIKGATAFLCVFESTTTKELDIGICFEKLVLEFNRMGLGTCWMAATFSARDFLSLAEKDEKEKLVIVSPIGHPVQSNQPRLPEILMGSNMRKPMDYFFFKGLEMGAEGAKLTEEEKKSPFGQVLEAVRWAPTATNIQSQRLFILPKSSSSSSSSFSLDSPLIVHFFGAPDRALEADVGISIHHFVFVMTEQLKRKGRLVILSKAKEEEEGVKYPTIQGSNPEAEKLTYCATWIEDGN